MSIGRAARMIRAQNDAAPVAIGAKTGDPAKPTDNRRRDRLSRAFLSDLRAVWKSELGPPSMLPRRQEFLEDLKRVYEAERTDDSPLRTLQTLGNRLGRWRQHCEEKLKVRLKKLPKDHPLKCPISLLGTMDYGRLEVAHTRALAWLLDPRREHGFDNALVNSMLSKLRRLGGRRTFCVRSVEAERFYKNSAKEDAGRTDVWVEGLWGEPEGGKRGLIVIEAKGRRKNKFTFCGAGSCNSNRAT